MTLLLDMAAPPWCLCASDSLIQGHHMQEAPSYVLCSLQRGTPSHCLPREGLLSLNRPQRKLSSARPWDGRTERPSCWPWAKPAGGPATMGSMRKSVSLSSGYHGQVPSSRSSFSITNQKRRKSEAQPLLLLHLPLKALSEL